MVKSLLTGAELRHAAKERIKRHREVMERKGYRTTSIFMSESIRAELKRLSEDMGLTRHDALDHIFRGYLASLDTPATMATTGLTTEELPGGKDIVEIQRDLFTGEAVVDLPTGAEPLDLEDNDPSETLRLTLIEYHGLPGTWAQRADKLNGLGITTAKGLSWTKDNLRIASNKEFKAQEG